jgi:hypothetical protein
VTMLDSLFPPGLLPTDGEWRTLEWMEPSSYTSESTYLVVSLWIGKLMPRALAAVLDESSTDADALRAWLPRPDELIRLAHTELVCGFYPSGAAHPALLCATLYADRLGDADAAAKIVEQGVLAVQGLGTAAHRGGMNPLTRIEAWRLLARCRGLRGDGAGALEALECALSESQAVEFVWMELKSLEDMLRWTDGDVAATRRVNERLAKAKAACSSPLVA